MGKALIDLLGVAIPLIQAPMAGVSTPELAAAVSNAGALGSVALGALTAADARQVLQETRARTDKPFAANVFVHPPPRSDPDRERALLAALAPLFAESGAPAPDRLDEIYLSFNEDDALCDALLEARPELVSLHFGVASPTRMNQLQGAGISVLATATSAEEARVLEASGVDVIVVQSDAAGGHNGRFLAAAVGTASQSLDILVAEIAATVTCPVIAAGGLMDGADIHRVMSAGAAGAQLGTAFIGCPETLASATYLDWLRRGTETRMTYAISGRPARGLINPLMQALDGLLEAVPDYPLTYDAIKQLVNAAADPAFSIMWAGTGAGRARFLGAAELVQTLAREMANARGGL